MSDVRELYQEMILDHTKQPRNFRKPPGANRTAEGYNPLCGDRFTVYMELDDGVIQDVGFQGGGCAISTASASMMTERIKGANLAEAEALFQRFHRLVTDKPDEPGASPELGKLACFSGVREYPIRVKCATLAWHTLRAAFAGKMETISTE